MCQTLDSNYGNLTKRNHKGFNIEHVHPFLNKSVTIIAEERGTNDIFVPVNIAAGYAWNNTPIDGTDILCSILAIGRKLHFPIDTNINTFLKMSQNICLDILN